MRQPGSSIKPLADYGPALDTGAITLATAIDDAPYYYPGENSKLVKNYFVGEYRGLMSVRTALKLSENVPAVKVLAQITPQVGFNYLLKFGFSTLISPKEAVNGNHDVVPSLALGGLTYGVHNIEMCAAYAAIANQGTYTQPVYYTQVKDKDGNVILDNTQPLTHTVLKKSTSWLLTNALESVTAAGTAEAAALSNQPTAGKTGTTQNVTDKWFCGYTPYYTAAIWLGYDDNSKELSGYIDHRKMWRTIMQEIHDNLPTGSFEKPDDIVETEVCSQSGKLPVAGLCDQDPRGSQLVTEYFSKDNNPTDTCDVHIKVTICDDTGKIASANCPHKTTKIMIKKLRLLRILQMKMRQLILHGIRNMQLPRNSFQRYVLHTAVHHQEAQAQAILQEPHIVQLLRLPQNLQHPAIAIRQVQRDDTESGWEITSHPLIFLHMRFKYP